MNYQKHYDRLMDRARSRILDCYTESHHITPVCMGGKGTEEVRLTAEEHYVAHQLLVKIYPKNSKLIYAANMMTMGKNRNNKVFGWIRRKFSKEHSKWMKENGSPPPKATRESGLKSYQTQLKNGTYSPPPHKVNKTSFTSEKLKGNKFASLPWITNGVDSKKLKNNEQMPVDWHFGRRIKCQNSL